MKKLLCLCLALVGLALVALPAVAGHCVVGRTGIVAFTGPTYAVGYPGAAIVVAPAVAQVVLPAYPVAPVAAAVPGYTPAPAVTAPVAAITTAATLPVLDAPTVSYLQALPVAQQVVFLERRYGGVVGRQLHTRYFARR